MYNNSLGDNVGISFRHESHNDISIHEPGYWDSNEPYGWAFPKTKYIMEVRSEQFFADVSIDVHSSALEMTDAIASCLVAGLKLIDGWQMIIHGVISQFKSGLGIDINNDVSSKIAKVAKTSVVYQGVDKYFIEIPLGIGFYTPSSNDMVAEMIDSGMVRLSFTITNRGKTVKFANECDSEYFAYYGSVMVDECKMAAISQLHEKEPELGTDWEMLRVIWFGNSQYLKKKGADSYIGKSFKPGGYINHAATPPGHGPPKDVRDLPGVNEVVKHPTQGGQRPLWSVIVDLNDREGWTREQIADWIETLDINISFGSANEQD